MIPASLRRSLFCRVARTAAPQLSPSLSHARIPARTSVYPTSLLHNGKVSFAAQRRSLSSVTQSPPGPIDSDSGNSDATANRVPPPEQPEQPAFALGEVMQKYDVLKIRQELEKKQTQKLTLRDTVFIKPKDVLDTVWATFDLSGSVSLAEIEHKQAELIVLKSEFRALDTAKRMLDQAAEHQANRAVWVGSILPVGSFLALCRMTYWEFSWDIVEPISFFVSTMGPICFFYVWFASKKEDFTMSTWREGMIQKSRETLYKAKAFDLQRYEAVAEAIRACEEDIRLLKQG